MRHHFVLWLALTAALAAFLSPIRAAVFERDWKAPGDGLLTYDDVNRREWLDLSVSSLNQFPGSTRLERIDSAVAEIAPGGLFEGFTFAKRADVTAFAQSAGIDTSLGDILINEDPTRKVIALLGVTLILSDDPNSIAFIDEIDVSTPSNPSQVGAEFRIHEPFPDRGYAGLFISSSSDLLAHGANGLMLFRMVPEPPSALLMATGFMAVLIAMRRIAS